VARFLGIDLGTTSFKAAALDLDRCELSHVRRVPVPAPVAGLPPTRYELDPAALIAAVRNLLGELLRDAPDATGLVMCSQMHCVVLTGARGEPHSNVITWKDQRALEASARGPGSVFDELARQVTTEEQHQIGRELRVGIPITTLYHLHQCGELPGGLFPASLPDFVLANLCGVGPTTEPTNAAAHGLFDLEKGDWHRELIGKLGLDSLRWPRVRPFGEVVGTAEIDGHRLTCFTPVGDQQCALAGVGSEEGELSLNISTGSQVSLVGRELPRGEFQVRPYFDGRWLRTIVSVPAGRPLGVLVGLLTEMGGDRDPWDYIAREVDRVGVTDLEVDLSFFASLTGDRGSITNIREGNLTVGHLFAAAFRAMARNYARCAAVLSPAREWQRVVFSGGLAVKFPRLRREILAALGEPPHRLCTSEEDTLAGLLALARVCAASAG
jgi:xylulokinase